MAACAPSASQDRFRQVVGVSQRVLVRGRGLLGHHRSIGLAGHTGLNLRRNVRFRSVILPDPSIFISYWSC